MSIIALIIALAPVILAVINWLIDRNRQTPEKDNANRHEQTNEDISKQDDLAASEHGIADLDALERLQNHPSSFGK